MSALGMHPTFTNLETYKQWISTWWKLYKQLSAEIRLEKIQVKQSQRVAPLDESTRTRQSNLQHKRVMASKMMTLRKDATIRWKRILDMKKQIEDQNASFPMEMGKVPTIDFHFNKAHMEFAEIIPQWIVKAKGMSFYVSHIRFVNATFDTKEMATGTTRGLLRLKHHHLTLHADGTATIEKVMVDEQSEAA